MTESEETTETPQRQAEWLEIWVASVRRKLSNTKLLGWAGAWLAILALALWLSQLAPIWLGVAAVGSTVWTVAIARFGGPVRLLATALLWSAVGVAGVIQVRLDEIAGNWERLQARIEEPLATALGEALDDLVERGELASAGAAEAAEQFAGTDNRPALFAALEDLRRTSGLTAIALFDSQGTTVAWAGEHRGSVPVAARAGTLNYLYQEGPLFSYLYFVRPLANGLTATAAVLLEASVDAGDGVVPFADRFERTHGARPRFWTPDRARPESIWDWATDERPILSVSFASLTQQDWWLRTAGNGRQGTALFTLGALLALTLGWYRGRGAASGWPVLVGTLALLIAPLDQLVGAAALFSPLQFVLPFPVDVTLGNLLVLLTGIAVWLLAGSRGRPERLLSPVVSGVGIALLIPSALAVIDRSANDGLLASRVAGGFALQLATTLLIAVPLFLLLRQTRPPIESRRSLLPRVVGILLPAALGIVLILWWQPHRPLPIVLAATWAVPALLLAGGGGSGTGMRAYLRPWLLATWLAGTVALAYLWPMHVRAELGRAERELALLGSQPDPFLDFLLRQFSERAAQLTTEGEGGVNLLYHSWVESGLAREGYEARLGVWREGAAVAELNLSELPPLPQRVLNDIATPREGATVIHYGGILGIHYLLSAPLPDGSTVSAAVPPRRRLGGESSLAGFLQPDPETPAGWSSDMLDLVPVGREDALGAMAPVAGVDTVRWVRVDEGWRSETLVEMPEGPMHAHFLLRVPPVPLLLTRATLVLTAIGATFLAVWLAAGLLSRRSVRGRLVSTAWLASFRGRLSVALFFFFLLPTLAFGAVSYSAVAREVIRSAQALAQQALDQAAARMPPSGFVGLGGTLRTDLLLYRNGMLVGATAPEVLELGLFNTWLPPAVSLRFGLGEEMQELEERSVAESDYLVAYRRIDPTSVLAAPIPLASNEITMRQAEFRDIALLVTLLGLGLSVFLALLVSRALARPLDELSRAAATVGGGNLSTRLPETRSDEFGNVYHSFNEMVGRLARTRTALVQETRRTETIVAEAATGVLALDPQGRVELINPRAAEILGGAAEVGDSLAQPDSALGSLSSAVLDLLRSPAPESGTEVEIDGRVVRLKLRRLPAEEGHGGAVIALEDVTAELRTARVIAWGEMARQVAHEIKNPLTPIKLAVQHLRRAFVDRRPDFDEILDRNVDSILREIDRLGEISRAFSRFGSPVVGSPLEQVDVRQVVGEVLALYRGSDGGASFRSDLPAIGLPRAIARTGELKEVLVNLLENAREAVDGNGQVIVSAGLGETPERLWISVSDNGVGIPAEQLPSIFDPHFSTRSSGTGLGLAIVRRMVESWGGEIVADSAVGSGTRFELRVRAAPDESHTSA